MPKLISDWNAVAMVYALVFASTEATKAANSSTRGIKGKMAAERHAAGKLLTALLGRKPTKDELDRATQL